MNRRAVSALPYCRRAGGSPKNTPLAGRCKGFEHRLRLLPLPQCALRNGLKEESIGCIFNKLYEMLARNV